MRTIDLQTWPRRQQYEIYRRFDHPHFSLCANVELGAFISRVKAGGFPVSAAIVYLISRAPTRSRSSATACAARKWWSMPPSTPR